jgi:Restriction endonuclease
LKHRHPKSTVRPSDAAVYDRGVTDPVVTRVAGSTEPEWRRYEKQIRDYLIERCGKQANIEYDVKVAGKLSGVDRQADIWVTGIFAGFIDDGTAIVDCKFFSKKVDVKDVEAFIGMVEDVDADFGVMFTTEGYTDAARRRVRRGIRLRVVPPLQLAEVDEELDEIYESLYRVTRDGEYTATYFDHEPYGQAGYEIAYRSRHVHRTLYAGPELHWTDEEGKTEVATLLLRDYLDDEPSSDLVNAFVAKIAADWDYDTEWRVEVPDLDDLAREHGVRHS